MRSKKQSIGLALVAIAVAAVVALCGCAAAPAPAPATPTTPSTPTSQAPQTLTIGVNQTLNWPLGLDAKKMVDWDIERVNKAGGLDIGGVKYKLAYSWGDNKMDEPLSKTVTQKLVHQDGVKFISGDIWTESSYPLAEQEHFILLSTPSNNSYLDPKWNWVWHPGAGNTNYLMTPAYVAKKFPNVKTFLGGYGDDANGRGFAKIVGKVAEASGLTRLEDQFYPAFGATDISAVGTRIKQLNPDLLAVVGGGPPGDSLVLKAAYTAGWRGQTIGASTAPGEAMIGLSGQGPVEGFISLSWPQEFDPAPNTVQKEWKDYYIAKYGKWDNPEPTEASSWFILKAALQKAGSLDTAKVKAALDGGVRCICALGDQMMIPRPDFNISRTAEGVYGDMIIKQIVGGQVKQIDKLDWPRTMELLKMQFGFTLPPPTTPALPE